MCKPRMVHVCTYHPPIHFIALTAIPVLSPVLFMPSLYYTFYNSKNFLFTSYICLTDRQTQTPINTETHRPGTTSSHTSSQESVTGGMPIVKRHLNADFSLLTELLKIDHMANTRQHNTLLYSTNMQNPRWNSYAGSGCRHIEQVPTTNITHIGTFHSYAHTHTVTLDMLVYTAHARTSPE